MRIMRKKLSDGRFIGMSAMEVVSFPTLDTAAGSQEETLIRANRLFQQAVQELHKLGLNSNTCGEILWLAEPAERQAFRSRVRLFLVFRCIDANAESLLQNLHLLQKNYKMLLQVQGFEFSELDETFALLSQLLYDVGSECTYAIIKSEKFLSNSLSPYPYYYTEVLPGRNTDNFEMLITALGESERCCVSFQIFPDTFTYNELQFINGQISELSSIASGFFAERQLIRDESATEPQKVLTYYMQHANSAIFRYNILVFGKRADCAAIAPKVISLMQAGREPLLNTDCLCMDISGENIRLPEQFLFYPWNLNNRILYQYRNQKILSSWRNVAELFRLPYLMTGEEVAAFFRFPIHNGNMAAIRSNQRSRLSEQFDRAVIDEKGIPLGRLLSNPKVRIGCPENIFTKHALIVGTPGSGKTTFSVGLLLNFATRGIPFLAIEPTKTEYRAMIDIIPDLQIFTPGNNAVSPFVVNPFIPPRGVQIEQYIPSLASAFKAAFAMPSPLDVLFLRAIRTCYIEHGWKDYSMNGDPDVQIFGLHEFILCFKRIISSSNYSREVKGNIESGGVFRLMNLIEQNRNIYDAVNTVPIEDLLRNPTVLELNAIDNSEQKALIMALLLINICVYTKANQAGNGKLKNAILIDEAHVLLSEGKPVSEGADSQGTTVKALQDMIAEIRSYGTSIIIADQSPSKVSREVIANTDIKVAFRLVQSSEKLLIADSTNMDDTAVNQLSRLKPGEAYVYFSRLDFPQLIQTDDIRENKGIRLTVPNEEVAQRMTYWTTRQGLLRPYAECGFCPDCRENCDFALRAQAVYFSHKLYSKHIGKIENHEILLHYLPQIDMLLQNVQGDLPAERARRLFNCVRLQLHRKIELEKGIALTRSELLTVLTQSKQRSDTQE